MTTHPTAHRIFVGSSVIAAALHILSVLVAGFLTPGYSQVRRAISDLGCNGQPYALLLNDFGLVIPGCLLLLAAYSCNKRPASPKAPKLGLSFMACAGLSLVIAGIYPFPSLIHLIFALLSGISAAVSILSLSSYIRKQNMSLFLSISGCAVAALILADATAWVIAETQHIRLHSFMGVQQRIASFSAFIWFSAFAVLSSRKIAASSQD